MMTSKTYNVIFATHDPIHPVRGGGGLRTRLVARALKERGWKVCLMAPAGKSRELDGIETISISAPRKQRSQILSAIKFNLRLLIRVIARLPGADVFVSHNTIACVFVPLLKWVFGFKFILDITDVHAEYLVIGRRNILERMAKPFLLWYEYLIIRSADRSFVATKKMRELLIGRKVDADKIDVVYDGVICRDWSSEKKPGSDKTIIHLGAIDRQHGVEVLMFAMQKVLAVCPDARLLVVGGGRELCAIEKLAGELGIEKSCEFTDHVPMSQAAGLLERASIGIIARLDMLANNIITTLKIFDYWASGTAVIATELDGIKEIARHGQDILFFRPEDAQDLAQKMIELLNDSRLRDKLIAAGAAKVRDFDFEEACGSIARMIVETGTEG